MQKEDHGRPSAAELAERVVRLGRDGLGRAEIAAALGVGLAELARMEGRSERLAAALVRAADAERAWWEAQPREALAAGARFSTGAWRDAMRWRFGDAGAAAGRAAGAGAGVPGAGEPDRPRAIYLIPDNGRELMPNGKPPTPEERRARDAAPVLAEIERLERRLAEWRERLEEVQAYDYDDDEEDWEEDDWDEEDDPDADDPDADVPDEDDPEEGDSGEGDGAEDDLRDDDPDQEARRADGGIDRDAFRAYLGAIYPDGQAARGGLETPGARDDAGGAAEGWRGDGFTRT